MKAIMRGIRGVVWGAHMKNAEIELKTIIDSYNKCGHEIVRERHNQAEHEIIFSNGDIWNAWRANEYRRGCKINISYIDKSIDPEIIETVIIPATIAPPYHALHYYYSY